MKPKPSRSSEKLGTWFIACFFFTALVVLAFLVLLVNLSSSFFWG